jgi:hypothetical protein
MRKTSKVPSQRTARLAAAVQERDTTVRDERFASVGMAGANAVAETQLTVLSRITAATTRSARPHRVG